MAKRRGPRDLDTKKLMNELHGTTGPKRSAADEIDDALARDAGTRRSTSTYGWPNASGAARPSSQLAAPYARVGDPTYVPNTMSARERKARRAAANKAHKSKSSRRRQ